MNTSVADVEAGPALVSSPPSGQETADRPIDEHVAVWSAHERFPTHTSTGDT